MSQQSSTRAHPTWTCPPSADDVKALLTGANGMLGRGIADLWRRRRPGDDLVLVDRSTVDLRDTEATRRLLGAESPDLVIHAAAVVGGIAAKLAHPARYLVENTLIDGSVLRASALAGVGSLVYVGSAAAYPRGRRSLCARSRCSRGDWSPRTRATGSRSSPA